MSCPQIYLGTNRFSSIPALAPEYANDSILPPSYDLVSGVAVNVGVTVYNHGTDPAPATNLELYWTTPATFVAPVNLINTYPFADQEITGAVSFPTPSEGHGSAPFHWIPSTIGHFCLFARLANTGMPAGGCLAQSFPTAGTDPSTDPLQGIHNVQVIAPAPAPHKAPPPRRRGPMWFGFAAANDFHGGEETKLAVRVLEPGKDREKLEALVSQLTVDRTLAQRNLKFHVPNGVHVAEGRERIVIPRSALYRKPNSHICIPEISRLGEISAEIAPHLVLPGSRLLDAAHGPIELKLLPGEQRQTFVQVEPGDHDNAVYAVEVSHYGADGRQIGGLVLLFVPPHDYF